MDMYSLTALEAGSPRSRCWQGWFLVKALFLACRWLSSGCVLTWLFFCELCSEVGGRQIKGGKGHYK